MDPSLLNELGAAATSAYTITGTNGLQVPAGLTKLQQSDPKLQSDGFAAVAYRDSQGNIIIAYDGTIPGFSTYGRGTLDADLAISGGKAPAALIEAAQFANDVQAQYGGQVYVTGHSLGGIEAEAACQSLGSACAGGATFGATGLPGTTSVGGNQNLVNYVDYGDPVGNYASDSKSPLSGIVPQDMYHYGSVEYVGSPFSAQGLQSSAAEIATSVDPWTAIGADGAGGAELAAAGLYELASGLTYHGLANYGTDLGVLTLKNAASPEIPLSDYLSIYGLPFGAVGETNAEAGTLDAGGDIITPDMTLSYDAATDQITIDQTHSIIGSAGTLEAGGITTIDLNSATGLPTEFDYKVPDGSNITVGVNDLTGAFTQIDANESDGSSYQINYNTAAGVALQTNFWSGQNETGTEVSTVINLSPNATDSVTFSNTTIDLGAGTNATVSGTGDTANILASGDILNTSGATVNIGAGFTTSVLGGGNLLTLGSLDTLSLSGKDNSVTCASDTIELSGNTSLAITGSGNLLYYGGRNDFADISSGTISEAAGIVAASITGNSDVAYLGSADTIGITGTGETVNANHDTINFGANTSLTANGGGDTLAFGGNDDFANGSNDTVVEAVGIGAASITGNGDVVQMGTADAIGVTGSGETVNANGDTINFGANTSLTANGGGDTLAFGGNDDFADGSNDTVVEAAGIGAASITGNDDVVQMGTADVIGITGIGETVDASGDTINFGAGATADIIGSTDLLGMADGGTAELSGSNDTADATDATVNFANGVTDSVVGNGDTVNLASGDTTELAGTGEFVSATGDTVNFANDSSAEIGGGSNLINMASGDTAELIGTGEWVSATGDTVNFSTNSSANIGGGSDIVNMASGDDLGLLGGSGYAVSASGDSIATWANTSFNLSGGGDSVTLGGTGDYLGLLGSANYNISGSGDTLATWANTSFTVAGDGDSIKLANGDYLGLTTNDSSDGISGSDDSIVTLSGITGSVTGSSDSMQIGADSTMNVAGSDNSISIGGGSSVGLISGTGEVIYASDTTLVMLGGVSATIYGSGDQVEGSNDTITYVGDDDNTVGSYDTLDATGTDDFYAGTGDSPDGAESYDDNLGDDPDPNDPLFTDDSGFGFAQAGAPAPNGDVVAQYDQAHGYGIAAAGAAAAMTNAEQSAAGQLATSAATLPASPSAGVWNGDVITWSFASGASSGPDPFSGAIGAPYQPVIEEAIQTWADVLGTCGITLEQVAGGTTADFQIGWGEFDTASSDVLGYTDIQRVGGLLLPGGSVRLEDPGETALVSGAGGQPTYVGTETSLYQMALHEIGHALGLQDVSDPHSIMYYALGAGNASLDATDAAAVQRAYAVSAVSASPGDVSRLDQMLASLGPHA